MTGIVDFLIVLLLLTNLRILGSSRIPACISAVALQGVLLAVILVSLSSEPLWGGTAAFALLLLAVKGVVLPWLLRRAMRDASVTREVEPFVDFSTLLLLGGGLMGLSFLIARPLQVSAPPSTEKGLLPSAFFTLLTGLLVIITRRKALTQVLGYLTMENGVYLFGVSQAIREPLLIELGILLDVMAAVFVMGIVLFQINREFDHIDTDRLSVLKE